MAQRSELLANDLIWRTPLYSAVPTLANALRETLSSQRPHMLEVIRLDEPPPHQAMTLAQWQRPAALRTLLADYADHIYRNQPHLPREGKPLLSLWAQWYLGLLVPPLMLALLAHDTALERWMSPRNIFTLNSMKPAARPASGPTCMPIATPRC